MSNPTEVQHLNEGQGPNTATSITTSTTTSVTASAAVGRLRKAPGINDLVLIADARERNVIKRHGYEFESINLVVDTLPTGDYILTEGDTVISVLERKTLEDFARSLLDGRHRNIAKLRSLRQETGCSIIYIIEGPVNPPQNSRYGRIPYSNIEACIDHITHRDRVTFIYTRDTLDTARRLVRYVRHMATLGHKHSFAGIADEAIAAHAGEVHLGEDTIAQLVMDVCALPGAVIDSSTNTTGTDSVGADGGTEQGPNMTNGQKISAEAIVPYRIPDVVKQVREPKTDRDYVRAIWAAAGARDTADDFIPTFSLEELARGIPRQRLAEHKLASGISPNPRLVTKLASVPNNKLVQIRMLDAVPGITRPVATELLRSVTLSALLSYPQGALGIRAVGRGKLGRAPAEAILRLFKWRPAADP